PVRAPLTEVGAGGVNAGRADDQRVHGAAQPVGQLPRRRDHLAAHLADGAVLLLADSQDRGHQSTFASWRSTRTSSGTASGPSPTIRPALRSGGSASDVTDTRMLPSAAGFASIGFFLAAMIPLSAG